MRRLFLKDGSIFTVPEIKKADEVRKYFGEPKGRDAAEEKREKPSSVSELRKSSAPEQMLGLAALFLPLALLFRGRKQWHRSR
jgi:hypothetical protein